MTRRQIQPTPARDGRRARCPHCGIPTVPDRTGLDRDSATCDRCYAEQIEREIAYAEDAIEAGQARWSETGSARGQR